MRPSREFHLGDKLRIGPSGVLGVGPGDGDEGRSVGPDALERCHDGSAELDAPSRADRARVYQLTRLIVPDQKRPEVQSAAGLILVEYSLRQCLPSQQ